MINVLYAIVVLSALALISLMLIQDGMDQRSVLMGVPPETLFGKNKSVSRDATLKRLTVYAAALFFVSTLVLARFS